MVSLLAGSTEAGFKDGAGDGARFNNPYSLTVDTNGNLYVADRDNHAVRKVTPDGEVTTFAGRRDGIAGTGVSGREDGTADQATFDGPFGIAVDAKGVVYVSDYNNHNIRKIAPVY